ncbi:ATP-binding cassette domain-containing protein [Neorhizobium sp. P12A]|nr:ATP-binding cassette domain-containing protein [Neorhizobium sp. P12A]
MNTSDKTSVAVNTATDDRLSPLLFVEGLTVRYGDFHALKDVSLSLAPYGTHAVIGPNGAGKSTLFNAISGFVKPTAGRVVFSGTDVTAWRPDRLARSGLARSFQISAIFPDLSVEDNLRMALGRHADKASLMSSRRAIGLGEEAARLLSETGLDLRRKERAADLSYGQKRLLELVTTLLLDPRLLMLDEPMAGLAREDIPEVTSLIAKAAGRCSVLLVEHNLHVVERLAQEVTVLAGGCLLSRGTYGEVASDPRVREAYIGGSASD